MSPYLAFCDFLLGADAKDSQTKLQATKSDKIVKQIVNSLVLKQPTASAVQPFEVQIFGALDVVDDVSAVYVAPSVAEAHQVNLQHFARNQEQPEDWVTFLKSPAPHQKPRPEKWVAGAPFGRRFAVELKNVLAVKAASSQKG